jgi:Protein of unknown function (DUF2934)
MLSMSETAQVHFVDLDIEDRKRAIAYQLWENEGRPEGCSETHWELACEIVAKEEESRPLPLGKVLKQEPASEPNWLKREGHQSGKRLIPPTPTTAEEAQEAIDDIKRRITGRSAA